MTDIPRRNQINRQTTAEAMIRAAMASVEKAGCSPHLTAAVVLLDRAFERVADFVDGVAPPTPSLHEPSCSCYPDCTDATCQGCECGAFETEKLRIALAMAGARIGEMEAKEERLRQVIKDDLASIQRRDERIAELEAAIAGHQQGTEAMMAIVRRVVTERDEKDARIDELVLQVDRIDQRLLRRVKEAEGLHAIAESLRAERDQNAELAREWREKAEAGVRAHATSLWDSSGERVALTGFRASAQALATFLEEVSGGEMAPSPAMASASAISYIRNLWEGMRHQRNVAEARAKRSEVPPAPDPLTDKTFYLVWNPNGAKPPSYRHGHEMDARVEATRLAKENPGQRFYVLRSTGMVVAASVIWLDHEIVDDEISPF